jgi:hypothetical protein
MSTSIQWLAYGSIWPVGARDFLVLTIEYTSHVNNSFMVVSTSIDHICGAEEKRVTSNNASRQGDSTSADSTQYTRSQMRLAGYIGILNPETGGTDLTLFLDVDLYSFVPSWAMHVLSQYGLTEMMKRIRSITSPAVPRSRTTSAVNIKASAAISDATDTKVLASTSQQNEASNETNSVVKGKQISQESQLLLRVYAGMEIDLAKQSVIENIPVFDWQVKAKKGDVEVSTSAVPGSPWIALRATTVIPSVKSIFLKDFLMDDSNLSSYDDMLDDIQVCILQYRV